MSLLGDLNDITKKYADNESSRTKILENEPLDKYTSLNVGGRAEFFVQPWQKEEIAEIYKYCYGKCKITILGGGTNLIFGDGLIEGLVISMRDFMFNSYSLDYTSEALAGCPLTHVTGSKFAGLEFMDGIPGTVGRAIYGNAGTVEHGFCELLESVTTVEPDGNIITWPIEKIKYSYRYCSLSDSDRLILSCVVRYGRGFVNEQLLKEYRDRRKKQPLGSRTAGSIFKNPENDSAGRLLEISGCKNLRVGDAVVSYKHANFIINAGHASGNDVINLINICREKVYNQTGILLEPEVKICT